MTQNGTFSWEKKKDRESNQLLTTWVCELESSKADIIEGLIVKDHALISIFNQLVDGESGIVGLNHCVRDLRGGKNREGHHHSIRVLFSDLRYQ